MGLFIFGLILMIFSFMLHRLNKETTEKINLRPWAWATRLIAVIMIVIGCFSATIVIVPAGYRGVLLRFSAVRGTLREGIHLIVPYMNSVELMEVRTQKESSEATAASKDLQIVTTSLALNFHIDPTRVGHLYKNIGANYKERIIDPAVQESIKMVTARYTAEELIKDRSAVKAAVEDDITDRLRAYDIIVERGGLSITNFNFSAEFNAAIEAKQVAQQEAEKQKYILQKAEMERQSMVARAKGEAESARLKAEALQAAGGGKVLAREWIEKWDGRLPTVSTGGNGVIVNIDSLMRTGQ